jgi:hypothetical protein
MQPFGIPLFLILSWTSFLTVATGMGLLGTRALGRGH